jgi:hypothetical protein
MENRGHSSAQKRTSGTPSIPTCEVSSAGTGFLAGVLAQATSTALTKNTMIVRKVRFQSAYFKDRPEESVLIARFHFRFMTVITPIRRTIQGSSLDLLDPAILTMALIANYHGNIYICICNFVSY